MPDAHVKNFSGIGVNPARTRIQNVFHGDQQDAFTCMDGDLAQVFLAALLETLEHRRDVEAAAAAFEARSDTAHRLLDAGTRERLQ